MTTFRSLMQTETNPGCRKNSRRDVRCKDNSPALRSDGLSGGTVAHPLLLVLSTAAELPSCGKHVV